MCGITGFLTRGGLASGQMAANVQAMTERLSHRGPDDSGIWLDVDAGIALGHRRLSIIDISAAGHQPMVSASGRYILSYNGEVYNHLEIRDDLTSRGITFRGESDTETLLAAVEAFGIEPMLEMSRGMFAFALWDKKDRVLTLARDRLGQKPLYYGWAGNSLLFASELKAMRSHPQWVGAMNRDILPAYLRLSYVPEPFTIYKDIHKLRPGHLLTVKAGSGGTISEQITPYWSASEAATQGLQSELRNLSEAEATDQLEAILGEAVEQRMISDVPLGAFLSGGIDSSLIVALMQAASSRPVKTFTIGFEEADYDESPHATRVAQHLGTDHTELRLSPGDALEVIPDLPGMWDEPFADSSQIPTYFVSRMARQDVTVALSGDGGDELFGGYNRHVWGPAIWAKIRYFPLPLRRAAGRLIQAVSPATIDRAYGLLKTGSVSEQNHQSNVGFKAHKFSHALMSDNPAQLYRNLRSIWQNPEALLTGSTLEPDLPELDLDKAPGDSMAEKMMFCDLISYLPGDILTKVDRASMAVSLEARSPFLDHKVVEFSWCLPESFKIRSMGGKWIVRRLLEKYIPREITERPKAGFGLPIDSWLRTELKDWMLDHLSPERLASDGIFRPDKVQKIIDSHLSGKRDFQHQLWNFVMFQAWADQG